MFVTINSKHTKLNPSLLFSLRGRQLYSDAIDALIHDAATSLMVRTAAHDGALMPGGRIVPLLLKLAENTLYAMANAGEMPAFKIRGQWRIKRAPLDKWIDARPRGGDGGRHGG